jgi:hypothetical protein
MRAFYFNIWPADSEQVETDNLIDLQGEEEPAEKAEPMEEGAEPQEEEAEQQEGAEQPEEEGAEGEETAEEPPADGDEMGNGDGE